MQFKIKKYRIIIFLLIFSVVLSICCSVYAEDTIEIPTKYDLSEHINVRVKNQGQTGSCWAFSTLSALETNLLLTQNEERDFSEKHLIYSISREFLNGKVNKLGYNKSLSGGNVILALSYMTRGSGPIDEEDLRFENNSNLIDISEIQGKTPQKKIEDFIIYPPIKKEKINANTLIYNTYQYGGPKVTIGENAVELIRNAIKINIMKFGAVTASTVTASDKVDITQYYNYNAPTVNGKRYPAYYCNDNDLSADHQVTIIGWDDNYSKENFNRSNKPIHNGAYLVLSSWGKTVLYPEGCYYISYDDVNIEKDIVGILKATDIDYDNIYQYDEFGPLLDFKINDNQVYGANVFKKGVNKIEKLKEISISGYTNMKCDIYVNPTDASLEFEKFVPVKKNATLKAGYTTIKLDSPIELKENYFTVLVKYYNNNNETGVNLGMETPDTFKKENQETDMWKYASSEAGQSYLYLKDESTGQYNWIDLKNTNVNNGNLCIKAFTENVGDYIRKGDVNGDGIIDILDIVAMKMHIVKIEELTGDNLKAADIDGDGKYAGILDLARLVDFEIGIIKNL